MSSDSEAIAIGSPTTQRVLSVGELVRLVASLVERTFPLSWVSGEVSNFTRASSGHWYFSLKDRDTQVRCVMFRSRNQQVDWALRDGDRVEARVLPGLYVPRGDFQLQVESVRRAGAGVLFEAFLRIKAALEAEGLFDPARKRPLPAHPRVIGIVTSMQAAALQDVVTTLGRRAPHVEVIVFPTPVQGQDASVRIAEAIAAATRPGSVSPVDVLLLVRGGGSIEDLWAFNDERVARAIAGAGVPVVSGIGHETDFTIADFVADLRAPTPTAAAELASPDRSLLAALVLRHRLALLRAHRRNMDLLAQRVDEAARRLRSPEQRLRFARDRVAQLSIRLGRAQAVAFTERTRVARLAGVRLRAAAPDQGRLAIERHGLRDRLVRAMTRRLAMATQVADGTGQRLALLDPKGILERGYAIVTDSHGTVVRDPARVQVGQWITIEVARGRFTGEKIDQD